MTLRNLDLNLLYVFSILMEEKSVSRAAQRLYIGQPGLSGALKRLREALNDELFVRTGRGLQPTARAIAIAPEIARALSALEQAVRAPEEFNPAVWDGEFRVGMCDNFELALFGRLTAQIRQYAPFSRVFAIASDKRDSVQLLEQGAYDFSVAVHEDPPSWHIREPLFEQHMVCIYDPQQLTLPAGLTIDGYQKLQHVIVSSAGDHSTQVDDALQAAGIKRNIVAGVSRHAAMAQLLKSIPAIATVPEITACTLSRLYGLEVRQPPIDLPTEPISMLYRRADQMDGRAIWLRNLFKEVLAQQQV